MGVSAAQGSAGLKPGVCTSTTRPSNPFEGQMIYETDTNKVYVWNGSAWSLITSANGGGSNVVLAYQQSTSIYYLTSNTLAGASDIFSSDLTWTADGTSTYWIEFCTPYAYTGYTGSEAYSNLFLVNGSGTDLGLFAVTGMNNVAAKRQYGSIYIKAPYTPSAGSVSINIRGIYVNGDNTGGLTAGSGGVGAYLPMWASVQGPYLS